MPFAAAIARHAEQIPQVPAFRMEGRVFTFRELALCAGQLVSAFGRLTADTGNKNVLPATTKLIALEIGNHPLFAAAFVAATSGGHCVVLIDPHLPETTRAAMRERLRPDITVRADGEGLRLDATASGQSLLFAAGSDEDMTPIAIGADDEPFLVVFTSGTTGMPKAIVRDRGSWRRSLKMGQDFFGIDRRHAHLRPRPARPWADALCVRRNACCRRRIRRHRRISMRRVRPRPSPRRMSDGSCWCRRC